MKFFSTKELNYLNDFLSWELISAKKCFQYGHQDKNSAQQQIFFDAAKVHQQNYLNLLNYIESNAKGGQSH